LIEGTNAALNRMAGKQTQILRLWRRMTMVGGRMTGFLALLNFLKAGGAALRPAWGFAYG